MTSAGDPLSSFSPRVREWFLSAFAAPTPAQAGAWPAIARGEHVLVSAPTGSGKTLAAFLWALDRLSTGQRSGAKATRVVYVSPLKALAYDIERNLRAPLRGIGAASDRDSVSSASKAVGAAIGTSADDDDACGIRVGIRTGDTPQRERAAMVRHPPDILVTTPESLYLILTSAAREMLREVEAVIVDEIHAVAHSKRGAHLALTLERLQRQARSGARRDEMQRIGLSATQSPLEEIARFLAGPSRRVTIVDAAVAPQLDLRVQVPVESMSEPNAPGDPLEPLPGGESTRGSIWPAIYPELLELVRRHASTIVFVNNRRSAERVALRLNELAGAEIARAHHGSLAREERTKVEELLKAGELPCLVATSSLELGIDMGAVDLVLQIESPKSVARGLQRIGRAGHGVGQVSRGRIFPKFRGDLLECAVLARRMREGLIEPTVVPQNALDVLAQQIVAIAVSAEPDGIGVDELHELVTATHSYATLSRALLENVLDMLDGRYPSREFAELRPRIVWDRLAGTIRARRGARQLAIANAGTIPDRGLYAVTLPDGRRVGELDEEMVYEARPGQAFLLGASTWRIEEIGRDRVIVTPAPGAPGAVPFWKGDSIGRPKQLGEAIGAFARWAVEQDERTLAREHDLDERAARNLLAYLREQQAATRVLPSDRTIVLERFRDEIGDWRLCLLSPYGARIHAAWALALSARIRDRFDLHADAIWSDDGIIVHLPDLDAEQADRGEGAQGGEGARSGQDDRAGIEAAGDADPLSCIAELVLLEPDEIAQAITAELGSSALFGARFRENAARALLIPRAWPGKRTPLWQQRLKAQSLLEVAARFEDFPIVLETYRECLRDVLDLPGLQELLRALHTREISLVEVETQSASPFASSLLFDYVATYMYEGDTPNAERRAAALALDRDLLQELLGSDELRELIDPGALARVQDDLQGRSPLTQATGRDELHQLLRRVGDLNREEVARRVLEGIDPDGLLVELVRERRAIAVRIGGEERFIAADDAGLYRDALAAMPPGGLPTAFLAPVKDALGELLARYARTHGPFTTAELHARYGVDASAALRELELRGLLVRAELRPNSVQPSRPPSERVDPTILADAREWCEVDVLRRLRRASLAALRKEIEPAQARRLAELMPAWQGVDRHSAAGAGIDRLREALVPLQGLALPAGIWERDVLPRRVGAYSPAWLDALCASGEVVWVGAGASGRSGRVALYFRDDAPLLGPPPGSGPAGRSGGEPAGRGGGEPAKRGGGDVAPGAPEHELLRARLAQGACFFTDLLAELDAPAEALREALWDLVWAGEVTNDAWAPLRAPRLALAPGRHAAGAAGGRGGPSMRRTRFGPRRSRGGLQVQLQGRWSLAATLFGAPGEPRRALAELLLERYGIVTREHVLAEGIAGGFALLYDTFANLETLGVCRRGYFIEGMGGAQFALPGAVERLRAKPDPGPSAQAGARRALVLAAADPAQPYGAALPWPRPDGREERGRRPARVAGAYVVLVAGEPILYVERGGRGLIVLVALDEHGDGGHSHAGHGRAHDIEEPVRTALQALAEAVRDGRIGRLALERIDGKPAVGSRWEGLLAELGFRAGPRRLTLSA